MNRQESRTTVLAAGRVHTGAQVLQPGWVEWSAGTVVSVGAGAAPSRAPDLRLPDATVVPGYVDVHVHGGGAASFGDGQRQAVAVVAAHRARGTTAMMASLVTDALPTLHRCVSWLAELVDDGLLVGVHLEGPWLSPRFRGAHDRRLLRLPEAEEVGRLLRLGRGTVRMVTLAPELEGGPDAVRRIVDGGAQAAIGHTDATYDQTVSALASGAAVGTHLFNAMREVHHREPGPALALLENEHVFVELIADGFHLHPAVLRASMAAAARPVLVTDAIAAAAAGDGRYRLGEADVTVSRGRAVLAGCDTLAGSTLTMADVVRYAVLRAGVPLEQAVRAATLSPADLLGRPDLGRLSPGARADLVVLDEALRPAAVLHAGRWVVGGTAPRIEPCRMSSGSASGKSP